MLKKISIGVFLVIFITVFLIPCFASSDITKSGLKMNLERAEVIVRGFARDAFLKSTLIILIIVFGALITLFQGFASDERKIIKIIIAVLGCSVSIITIINSTFYTIDPNTAKCYQYEGEKILGKMRINYDLIQDIKKDNTHLALFTNQFDEVVDLKTRYLNENKNKKIKKPEDGTFNFTFGLKLYAQNLGDPSAPSWVKKIPDEDKNSLYFKGEGTSPDLNTAKQNSLNNAKKVASMELSKRLTYIEEKQSIAYFFAEKATIVDTYQAVSGSNFVCFTLIKINKKLFEDYLSSYELKSLKNVSEKTKIIELLKQSK